LYAARREDAKLLGVLLKLSELVTDDKLKAHYLHSASILCEDRLNLDPQAAELLNQAFALRRRDPMILSSVKRRAERQNAGEDLLKALAAEAEGLGAAAGPAYYQISRVYEKMGRAED